MGWLDRLFWPREAISDLQRDVAALRLEDIPRLKIFMEAKMADVSQVLNEVADGLRGPLATSISELLSEHAALKAENAQLKGEDEAESTAAANVKSAFDEVAAKFAPVEEVPDVEPLPEPEAPAEPAPAEPAAGEGDEPTPPPAA